MCACFHWQCRRYVLISDVLLSHYIDVIMGAIASQITSLTIVYSTVYSDRPRSKKTSKLRVTAFCVGNSPGTGEFPAQMASNAENVSIWSRHHVCIAAELSWGANCDTIGSLFFRLEQRVLKKKRKNWSLNLKPSVKWVPGRNLGCFCHLSPYNLYKNLNEWSNEGNLLGLGNVAKIFMDDIKKCFDNWYLANSPRNCPQMKTTGLPWWDWVR